MNYALNYMYSELVFQLDGNNINIDVTIIQCFAFGYHTNKNFYNKHHSRFLYYQ